MALNKHLSRLGGSLLLLSLCACTAQTVGENDTSTSATAAVPGPAMAETGTWTFAFQQTAISAPKGCRMIEKDDVQEGSIWCVISRERGSAVFVRLDEWLELTRKPGVTPDYATGIALVMNDGFDNFVKSSLEGSKTRNVTAASVPSARLPKGMSACKAYGMDQTHADKESGWSVREKGLYCAVAGPEGVWTMIASVADLAQTSLGQGHAANFDAYASGILSTYRMR